MEYKIIDKIQFNKLETKLLDLISKPVTIFGEFALSVIMGVSHPRRINIMTEMSESEIKSKVTDDFIFTKISNDHVCQVVVTYKDDVNFDLPFLCIYCFVQCEYSLIEETPFACLQTCIVVNEKETTIGMTKECKKCLETSELKIICMNEQDMKYIKKYVDYYSRRFNIRISTQLINGVVYDSSFLQTF